MIVTEPTEPSVTVVTWGGVVTGADQNVSQEQMQPHVQPMVQKKVSFDIQKHKQVFMDMWPEFVDPGEPLTSEEVKKIPEQF